MMVYVVAVVITVALAWFFFRKPTPSRPVSRRKTIKKVQAPQPSQTPENILEFDLKQGEAVLVQTQMPPLADVSVREAYKQRLDDIPSLPTVWPDLLRAIEQGAAARKVAQLIKSEPTLAVEVLRQANTFSAKDINDLGQAIVLLGYNSVRGIVTKHCFSGLKSQAASPYQSAVLWKHAIAVSGLASITAKYIKGCDSGVAGTLGLLHDLGRIGINIALKKRQQVKLSKEQGYLKFERETFGISHLEAGGLLAKHWLLPDAIQDGITFHHHPAFAQPDTIPKHIRKEVLAVYLADLLAIHFEFHGGHKLVCLPLPAYADMLSSSLQEIAEDPAISKELWRVKAINF